MAAVASAERKWTEAGIPLTTRLLEWVVSASTLVTCCRKWSAQNWPLYQTTPSPQHYDGRDQNELNIGAEEGLFPWILGHCPLGFDLLEYRRFLKMHPDIVGDEHQQEREQERDAPAPVVERGLAEIGACCDDDEERQYDSKGGRGLQPASVVPDAGRLRVVVRQLVPVLRHRQHPHGAERGNHRDIHDDPHGPIPGFTQ